MTFQVSAKQRRRSTSRPSFPRRRKNISSLGTSVITVVFEDGMDVYFARQGVLERVLQARTRLPQGAEPVLGPVSTGLSEVFMYVVEGSGQSLMDLRTLQDWVIRPMLGAVRGLADVDTLGGLAKRYEVLVDPNRLTSLGLTLSQVQRAVADNNQNAGGSYIEQGGDKLVVYGVGLARNAEDLERIVNENDERRKQKESAAVAAALQQQQQQQQKGGLFGR